MPVILRDIPDQYQYAEQQMRRGVIQRLTNPLVRWDDTIVMPFIAVLAAIGLFLAFLGGIEAVKPPKARQHKTVKRRRNEEDDIEDPLEWGESYHDEPMYDSRYEELSNGSHTIIIAEKQNQY